MSKNRINCWYSARCKSYGVGCIREVANAKNCGFIAQVEKTESRLENALLRVLRHSKTGSYSQADKWYVMLRAKTLLTLTEGEFRKAEDSAVEKFCIERRKALEKLQSGRSCHLAAFLINFGRML